MRPNGYETYEIPPRFLRQKLAESPAVIAPPGLRESFPVLLNVADVDDDDADVIICDEDDGESEFNLPSASWVGHTPLHPPLPDFSSESPVSEPIQFGSNQEESPPPRHRRLAAKFNINF